MQLDNMFSQNTQNVFKRKQTSSHYDEIPDAPSQISSQFFSQRPSFMGYTQNIEVCNDIFSVPSSAISQLHQEPFTFADDDTGTNSSPKHFRSSQQDLFTSPQHQQQLLNKQHERYKKHYEINPQLLGIPSQPSYESIQFRNKGNKSMLKSNMKYAPTSMIMKTPKCSNLLNTELNNTQPIIQLETPRNAAVNVQNNDGTTGELKSVREIPEKFRSIFPFAYFNTLQSKVFEEVLYSDNPVVVCAPTGSGKTVLFELCVVRLLLRAPNKKFSYKIIYMAPIKALCSERYQDWNAKFSPFGLKCTELTGDTELDDFHELQYSHIVFTTPEKWDSMTRKWKDNKSLVHSVRLFLIDEVHLLNDNTRGATMEAVVSRMKTVQVSINNDTKETDTPIIRFVAISATIPNVKDIAVWLDTGVLPALSFSLGDEYRPVALRKIVLGYPYTEKQSDFKFDLALNYKLSNIIQTYSENKPTLVFCCTRKGVTQAASVLVKDARFILNYQHKQRLTQHANIIHDSKLQEFVLHGVGFHHAGLDMSDRKHIEEMFTTGDLPVLFCTSTLAMGVNLPAHLVVVKGTMHYVMGGYEEYSEAQVLQMMGRAGRPQFDTSATAVIMTKQQTKAKYQAMITGTHSIESSLHHHLTEHINAEIVLGTITDIDVAQDWLKSTFLYKRMQENPKHYGAPDSLDKKALGQKLQDMCLSSLKSLQSYNLLELHNNHALSSTEIGKLMARYCIAFDTVKILSSSSGNESLEELVGLLSKAKEFDDITIRQNEKKVLNTLNKDKNRITIRFPLNSRIKSTEMKINCLLQSTLGCLTVNEFSLTQDITKILRIGQRVTKFMMEFLVQQSGFQTALNAILLCKCVKARLWENSKFVSKQLERIGPSLSSALVNAGITTFQKMENTNPRELEMIMNRHPPFGSQIKEVVSSLPKMDVIVEQDNNYRTSVAELVLIVKLLNSEVRSKYLKAKKTYTQGYYFIIGDSENQIVFKQKIFDSSLLHSGQWSRRITIQRASKSQELSIKLICLDYVGLDVQSSFTPVYAGPPSRPVMTNRYDEIDYQRKPSIGNLY
ncbi:probable ATP-dependent DNA helicase HFM1 [Hydractinia symbiolongicarpus]|uniref:probable ATP-dependent DNA helicase HFM1 n=1 Tax=Hydractinia symbiolongicarpus TaxID=13093 RepID=UPI00254AF109|nr:probable ATP-dependent DNA helicase HFM1 [Hydractinia symbiolongicarpus]